MIDKRMNQIIKKIFENSYVSKTDLMKGCSLTKRKLNYSLEKINSWLKHNKVEPITFINNYVSISPSTYKFLLATIKTDEEAKLKEYLLNTQERSKYLFLMLLAAPCELSINHFIFELDVSKSTIIKDLKLLEQELYKYNIKVIYSKKDGYFLSGDEGQIRYYLMELVMNCVFMDNKKILDLFIKENQMESFDVMSNIIVRLAEEHYISFSGNRLIEFVYSFILLKPRFQINAQYIAKEINLSKICDTSEYNFSLSLLNEMVDIPSESIMYLCTWLMGATEVNIKKADESFSYILELVENILVRFEFLSGIILDNREYVKHQISLHFRAFHYRLMFKLPIINPICDLIKKEYEDLYILVKETMKYYETTFHRQVPNDEIAYLVIHIVSLIGKSPAKKKKEETTAVLVCPNGVGSSMILNKQLKSLFPDFIFLDPISKVELKVALLNVDLIFSTTSNIKFLEIDKPCFVVNTIMTLAEKHQLVREVYMEFGNTILKMPSITQIIEIIEKYVDIDKKILLRKKFINPC